MSKKKKNKKNTVDDVSSPQEGSQATDNEAVAVEDPSEDAQAQQPNAVVTEGPDTSAVQVSDPSEQRSPQETINANGGSTTAEKTGSSIDSIMLEKRPIPSTFDEIRCFAKCLQAELSDLRSQHDRAVKDCDDLRLLAQANPHVPSLAKMLIEKDARIRKHEKAYADIKAQYQLLQQQAGVPLAPEPEVSFGKAVLEATKDGEIIRLKEEIKRLTDESLKASTISSHFERLKAELESKEKARAEAEKELQLALSERNQAQSVAIQYQQKQVALERRIADLESSVHAEDGAMRDEASSLADVKRYESRILELQSIIEGQEKQISDLTQQTESQNPMMNEITNTVQLYVKAVEERDQALGVLVEQRTSLANEAEELRGRLHAVTEQYDASVNQIHTLMAKTQTLEGKFDEANGNIELLMQRIHPLLMQKAEVEDRLRQTEQKMQILVQQLHIGQQTPVPCNHEHATHPCGAHHNGAVESSISHGHPGSNDLVHRFEVHASHPERVVPHETHVAMPANSPQPSSVATGNNKMAYVYQYDVNAV